MFFKRINFLFIIILLSLARTVFSQQADGEIVLAKVHKGDTLIVMSLPEVHVYAKVIFKTKREARRYGRLVKHVRKVYPFARLAGLKMEEYSIKLQDISSPKERKKFIKQAEKDLFDEYGEELKRLTFTQGKILLKLVDRQTGHSSYHIVEELRGSFSAFFWQSLARIFGYNLKVAYKPDSDDLDRQIEEIVQMIERGDL